MSENFIRNTGIVNDIIWWNEAIQFINRVVESLFGPTMFFEAHFHGRKTIAAGIDFILYSILVGKFMAYHQKPHCSHERRRAWIADFIADRAIKVDRSQWVAEFRKTEQ